MATQVKPTRLKITGTPSVWQVPMYVDADNFQWWSAGSSWYGRFLSLRDCTTWQPISFPEATPYTYTTWDYYMVETVSTTTPPVNYRPNWSSYTGTASSTAETDEVLVWDVYVYDGSVWLLQSNNWKTVAFANIAWQPTDNVNLASALSWKLDTTALNNTAYWSSWDWDTTHAPTKDAVYDKISAMDTTIWTKANDSDVVKLTWNQSIAWTKTFTTSPVVPSKTSDATNTWTAIATEAQVYKKQDTLTTQTAYTSKWTSTKVATITTNTLWQVTWITETSIAFPVTSVNGSTWAVSLSIPANTSDLNNDSGFITSASLPWTATSSTAWLIKLASDTTQTETAEAVSSTAWRTYWIQLNSSNQAVVNVPRTDNNTTYSAWTWLSLTGTTFANTWVTSFNGSTWAVTYTAPAETVVSWDSWTTYTIKVSASAPWSWTPATTITFVTA